MIINLQTELFGKICEKFINFYKIFVFVSCVYWYETKNIYIYCISACLYEYAFCLKVLYVWKFKCLYLYFKTIPHKIKIYTKQFKEKKNN